MYDNLTKDDIKKMQEEIEYRKLVVRKEALEAVKEARALGDLSENIEYKAAKQDKNRNESRIRYLEKMIKTARIVSDESKSDEVGLGDRVELYIPEDDGTLVTRNQESYASVKLELNGEMSEDQAASLARYIATEIGNSSTDNITIIDSNSNLLFAGGEESTAIGTASTQLSYQTK